MNPVILRTLIFLLTIFPSLLFAQTFRSEWHKYPDRTWAGPEIWANRLQDWQIEEGKLVCDNPQPLRTAHLLTHRVDSSSGNLRMKVSFEIEMDSGTVTEATKAGFLLGAGGELDYRAAALIQYSYGKGAGLFAGIDGSGRLFVQDLRQDSLYLAQDSNRLDFMPSTVRLELMMRPAGERRSLKIEAFAGDSDLSLGSLEIAKLRANRTLGNVGLICHAGDSPGFGRILYSQWEVRGSGMTVDKSRTCGPIISAQHSLNRGVLKLTAQVMPIGVQDEQTVTLELNQGGRWRQVDTTQIIQPGYTAPFRVEGWSADQDIAYRLVYRAWFTDSTTRKYYFEGTVRREPMDKEDLVVAAFTGNHNVARPSKTKWAGVDGGEFPWNEAVWFPHTQLIQHVKSHGPDLLFFSGDQVYEGASPTYADVAQAELDYLYKWYLWCWAFGELTADIPSVVIPDDHDVYHGNIWGAGGKATPPGLAGAQAQDEGGYKMPASWVNMVHRTQTSHLPDPYDPRPIQQGISVYYTDLTYGGISFAVLADRMFKSAPKPLMPEGGIYNGWAIADEFDPVLDANIPEAELLGDRQLEFLEEWASDWRPGTWMKAVLSQTIFANVATLPADAKNDGVVPELKILSPGSYPRNDRKVADMDSNGWPKEGRDEALRIMRKGFAVHIAGDQHLGSTIQYGVEEWGDAGYALCVPSIANFFPRRWFPPQPGNNQKANAPRYTGEFEDGFGNKMTVHAVSNPHISGQKPALLHDLAAGYGIVRFNRKSRKISLEAWPIWSNPEKGGKPYEGWPIVVDQMDNFGKEAVGYLPKLKITGMNDPVIQVSREETGEILYTMRINGKSFEPWVFDPGRYRIRIGEPGTGQEKVYTNLTLSDGGIIKVKF